ncbi:MAG TPA: branched-chain amino acid ABC transporter permease [Candidatus Limnocylindrales bacterium]|nr:branched-chain amino acid ABC transporter permease [Candidatus Limnocylindrales bacterium]
MSELLKLASPFGLCAAVLIVLAFVLPPFFGSYYHFVAGLALINVIIAIGLNILTGNAGQISMCQASFMAIGAYSTTYFFTKFGMNYWMALPLGGLFSAVCGFAVGFPALRLRGFYLAVATLGFLEFSQILIENLPSVTGGVRGMSSGRPFLFGVKLSSDLYFYYVILIISLVGIWCAHSLLKSPTGRAFNAIRNSEAAAQTLAIPLARTKLIAFVISSFYAGIGGGLYATLVGFIDPLEFNLLTSVRHIIFITVGGLGSVTGAIIGAIAFTILPELLRGSKEYNEFVFGGILLLTLIFMPTGIVGLAPALRRYRSRSKTGTTIKAWGPH